MILVSRASEAISAFTRVFDALWRTRPGTQRNTRPAKKAHEFVNPWVPALRSLPLAWPGHESAYISTTIPSSAISKPAALASSTFASIEGFMCVSMIRLAGRLASLGLRISQLRWPLSTPA